VCAIAGIKASAKCSTAKSKIGSREARPWFWLCLASAVAPKCALVQSAAVFAECRDRARCCASSDKLRACARCTSCGGKGATLQRPGWAGNHVGFYPFPTTQNAN
jgi:hypothetical protein